MSQYCMTVKGTVRHRPNSDVSSQGIGLPWNKKAYVAELSRITAQFLETECMDAAPIVSLCE
jgi:hypothetical protein